MEKEKKVLFVATVVKTHINVFHLPYLKMLKEMGYKTYVAAKNDFENEPCIIPYCDCYFDIPFARSPLNKNNLSAYKMLKKIINEENFDIIHCHTPVGSVLTRLAARKSRKQDTKVIYTAHGFHFHKKTSLKNWFLYYPVEKLCSYFTDVLITINKEDYALAQKKMKAKKIYYVPGVGVNVEKYTPNMIDAALKRKELNIPNNYVWVLATGELIKRKNHETLIRAISDLDNIYLTIAGQGKLREYLQNLINELNISGRVKLLGFRSDISELCSSADIFAFPSFTEGLGIAALEAMACGLPIITSDVHGINDYSIDGVTGYKCDPHDVSQLRECIKKLAASEDDRKKFGTNNIESVKKYDIKNIEKIMRKIYECLD